MYETQQPDYSGGCMLALYPTPDIAAALALPGGLNPAELHVTVAYTGDAADTDPQDLIAAALDAARRVGPFTATICGSARFTGGQQDVLVALVDAPQLEDLRRAAGDALHAHRVVVPRTHGFTPHITRRYAEPDEDDAGRLAPLTFLVGALSVVHGATRIDIPLAAHGEHRTPPTRPPIAQQAREAYAEGWARSGGPMTDRVKAGCTAAVRLAREHAHQPGILEATLRLGSLEGTWALVFARRDELAAKHTALMRAAWRDAAATLDTGALVRQIRTELGMAESAGDQAERARKAARDAALQLLAWLPATRAWQGLRDAMRDALRRGRAEGAADAIAIAGEAAGRIGVDFDLAFAHAYEALAALGQLWADADGWLARMVERSAGELGRTLGELAADGAPYQDMLAAAGAVLDGTDGDAVEFITDWALSTGLSQGALGLYASEGVQAVDWVTAGDGRVCFPAGTPVRTANGATAIDQLAVGDEVSTPAGPRRVSAVFERPYRGLMVIASAGDRIVAATEDHPFWTPSGWLRAGDLRFGDFLKSADNELIEVDSVLHVDVKQADGGPTESGEFGIASCVSRRGPGVPIGAVSLEHDLHIGQREVDGPSPDLALLREGEPEPLEGHADAGLKAILAPVTPVARDAAKSPNGDVAWSPALDAPTLNTGHGYGWASAGLRAEVPIEPLLGPEALSAAFAVDVLGVGSLAGVRADVVPVRDRPLRDREVEAANGTGLRDGVRPAGLVALPSAENPIGAPTRFLRVEDTVASPAGAFAEDCSASVSAKARAEDSPARGARFTHEFFSTLFAGESKGHLGGASSPIVLYTESFQVYDIEVTDEHTFYASDLLVHNCPLCEANEENGPYAPADFPSQPAHPKCRCASSAAFDLGRFAAYFAD